MTRSITALSAAAMLVAVAMPATASAQDTTSTGGRTKSDSASGRSMGMQRFDTTQAVSLTGVTILRIDSIGGGKGAWNGGARGGMAAAASGAMGAGSTGTMGAGTASTSAMAHGPNHTVSAVVSSGADSMQIVLAPADFLASNQLTLAAGDVINIKGVRLASSAGMGAGMHAGMHAGAGASSSAMGSSTTTGSTTTGASIGAAASAVTTTVLATEITKGDKTVQLRDRSTGAPKWSTSASEAGMSRSTLPPTKTDSVISPVRKP